MKQTWVYMCSPSRSPLPVLVGFMFLGSYSFFQVIELLLGSQELLIIRSVSVVSSAMPPLSYLIVFEFSLFFPSLAKGLSILPVLKKKNQLLTSLIFPTLFSFSVNFLL